MAFIATSPWVSEHTPEEKVAIPLFLKEGESHFRMGVRRQESEV